jgi:hypothetical protein
MDKLKELSVHQKLVDLVEELKLGSDLKLNSFRN